MTAESEQHAKRISNRKGVHRRRGTMVATCISCRTPVRLCQDGSINWHMSAKGRIKCPGAGRRA